MNYIAAWMNIPRELEIIELGMDIGHWDQLDDISSYQPIGPWCHNPFLKLSPHSSKLSPLHHMHLTPIWPGSAGGPYHPQLFSTSHQVSPSSHLGLGPRHLSDHNPIASGMQTSSEIMG